MDNKNYSKSEKALEKKSVGAVMEKDAECVISEIEFADSRDNDRLVGMVDEDYASALFAGLCERSDSNSILNDKLVATQTKAIELLEKTYGVMLVLSAIRMECKLSNTRAIGVAREIRELIKVMSVYK